jgi:putative phosphoribosyl transferase
MVFKNRHDAAIKLMPHLEKYRSEGELVLAVPRGGVPIAYYIAKEYNMPLDLLMTKKIGHPLNEEFAIGAVSTEDHVVDEGHGLPESYIEKKVAEIRQSLLERYKMFMGNHKAGSMEGKTVLVVDDGIATGNTILATIKMLRKKNPRKIVVVSPVASTSAAKKISEQVDDFICLYTPETFIGVGLYYDDFSEVSDHEVMRLLAEVNHMDSAA